FVFFFFQAEDGIRDFHVTGVQTCALPILKARLEKSQSQLDKEQEALRAKKEELDKKRLAMDEATLRQRMEELDKELVRVSNLYEIGRASCRERVSIGRGDVPVNEKRDVRE